MEREYSTKHLTEAACLIVNDEKLIRIDRNGKTCWFVFANSENRQIITNQFFFGDVKVSARGFSEAIALLKNRIFASE